VPVLSLRAFSVSLVLAAVLGVALPADARTPAPGALERGEREQLLAGDVVRRPLTFEKAGGRYVGGTSYQLVRAGPEEVLAALGSVETLPQALPRTKRARLVDIRGRLARVELVQGNALVEARYTVALERVSERNELRFWLDRSRPHDIDDVWGYFRVVPFGKGQSLVTVAVALDVGPGLVRMLFEERIREVILATPVHIKRFIEPRALADAR
jgi:hypothetical protein